MPAAIKVHNPYEGPVLSAYDQQMLHDEVNYAAYAQGYEQYEVPQQVYEEPESFYAESFPPTEIDCRVATCGPDMQEIFLGVNSKKNKYHGGGVTNLFLGQLPWGITPEQVNSLIRNVGGAKHVYGIACQKEKEEKRRGKELRSTGCLYAEIASEEANFVIANLHHRVLIHGSQFLLSTGATLDDATLRKRGLRGVVCEEAKCQGPVGKRFAPRSFVEQRVR